MLMEVGPFSQARFFKQREGKRPIYVFRFNKLVSLQISKDINSIVADPYCVKGLSE